MKYNRDFKYLYRRGKSVAAGYLVLYYKKTRDTENTLGITVTKKLGCAVVRNRVRRLIKECYRLREHELAVGYKMVIVARNRAAPGRFLQYPGRHRILAEKKRYPAAAGNKRTGQREQVR